MASWSQRAFRAYVSGPDHPAKLRIVRQFWRWFVPPEGVLCEISGGGQMWLHPDDTIEERLYTSRGYEEMTHEFLVKNLSLGSVAMFAGANSGLYLISSGRLVGQNGRIIGVEPQPLSLCRAMRNIRVNDLKNVVLVSAGLGNKDAIIPMGEVPETHTGWGSFVLREAGNTPFHVSVWKYDSLLDQLQLSTVDLMLLDVEGYELRVLEGMSPARSPGILLVELHPPVLKLLSQTDANYYEILHRMGYATWTLEGKPASPGMELPESNLVCVKEGVSIPNWANPNRSDSHE